LLHNDHKISLLLSVGYVISKEVIFIREWQVLYKLPELRENVRRSRAAHGSPPRCI